MDDRPFGARFIMELTRSAPVTKPRALALNAVLDGHDSPRRQLSCCRVLRGRRRDQQRPDHRGRPANPSARSAQEVVWHRPVAQDEG